MTRLEELARKQIASSTGSSFISIADARFCKCSISVPADGSNVKCAKCNLPINSGVKQEFNAALPERKE